MFVQAQHVIPGEEVRFNDGVRWGPWRYVRSTQTDFDGWLTLRFADDSTRRIRYAQVVEVRGG